MRYKDIFCVSEIKSIEYKDVSSLIYIIGTHFYKGVTGYVVNMLLADTVYN